jgi:prolipoprotein diacylglyceryltransferase/predicted O-methyltransferase YrrM
MYPYIRIGSFELGTFGLLVWLAFVAAYFVLAYDFRRRRLKVDAASLIGAAAFAGIAGAKIWHLIDTPQDLRDFPASGGVGAMLGWFRTGFAWFGGFVGGLLTLIYFARKYKVNVLTFLDACSPAAAVGYGIGRIGCLISGDGDYGKPTTSWMGMGFPNGIDPTPPGVKVWPTPIFETIAALIIAWALWKQGEKSSKGPRPVGEVLAWYLILMGLERFLIEFIRQNPRVILGMSNAQVAGLLSFVIGVGMLAVIRRRFRTLKGEHRILTHQAERGDVLQPEYHRATPECPHPERWRMYDSMTAEYEVLQYLKTLVTTIKPELVVETGTFSAVSTLWIAEALKENGFGKIISCEYDPKVYARAKERVAQSGLAQWIELRNESSLEMRVNGEIDLFFSDSDPPLREKEVRRFLPQIKPTGVILMHDASSHMKTVREAALRLEQEGLISVVMLSTPRGLVIAQRREARR